MTDARVRLGIDFGTSNTVAVLAIDGRAPRTLLFDGSPLLPSAVCLESPGHLVVGRDAWHLAVAEPASFEPYPKRCVDDGSVLLGGAEVPVVELFGAVIGRVLAEAGAAAGDAPEQTVLTYPAAWSASRRATLLAAVPAGVLLVPEPVAAASYFTELAGHQVPEGATAVVYDFGAGTFDATVLRRGAGGFEVLDTRGLPDAGGLDIDAAIVAHLAETLAGHERWGELEQPRTAAQRRARQQLWDGARQAKEMLSRSTTTLIHVPLLEVEVPLGRQTLDEIAAPVLERTVATTREAVDLAGIGLDQVAAVFLSGGSSRMPAVATTLHRSLGIRPVTVDQPELAVAEGSLRAVAAMDTHGGWPGPPTAILPDPTPAGAVGAAGAVGVPAAPWPGRLRSVPARLRSAPASAAAALLAVVAAATALTWAGTRTGGDGDGAAPDPAGGSSSPAAQASPSPSFRPGVDPCLLGSWRVVTARVYGLIDNVKVQYTGGAGVVFSFRADGTSVDDYSAMQPRTAVYKGATWSDVTRGTTTFHYHAKDGVLQSTVISTDAVGTLTRNGKFNASAPASYNLESAEYVCTEDTLRLTSTLGTYASESQRIPPPSPSAGDAPATAPSGG